MSSDIKEEIYFIQDSLSKRIKIGYTTNLKIRFQTLSGSNANKLFILGSIPGTEKDEAKLHKNFIEDRAHGEWFHPSSEILDFIHEAMRAKKPIAIKKEKKNKEEILYSISKVAKNLQLSRSRFYQLLDDGFFSKPLYDKRTKRPYYTSSLMAEAKKVLRTSMGVNGKICLFYRPR